MDFDENKKRWLDKRISKYSEDKNKDLVENLFNQLMEFLQKNDNIYLEDDLESFKINFYNFIYNKYG